MEPLLPRPEHNPHRREGDDWARSHIGHSVLEGHLHRAVAGDLGLLRGVAVAGTRPASVAGAGRSGGRDRRPPGYAGVRSQPDQAIRATAGYSSWGWTTERFGSFDRTWDVDGIGPPSKESIGRKYQWIAYREVLALIADHFQYREYPADLYRNHRYLGPWQNWLRDIDPTLTGTLPAGTRRSYRQGHTRVWWTAGGYDGWEDSDRLREWVLRRDDLPKP